MELAILEAVYFLNSDSSTFFKLVIRGNNCTCRQSNTLWQDFILFIDIVCVQVNLQTLLLIMYPLRRRTPLFTGSIIFPRRWYCWLVTHSSLFVRENCVTNRKNLLKFFWKKIVIDHVLLTYPRIFLISRELRAKFRNRGYGDVCRALSKVILR